MTDYRFNYIRHKQNLGHIYSANEGLSLTRARYILRLDVDDYLADDFFAKALMILEYHPEVGLLYGNVSLVDSESKITAYAVDTVHGGLDFKGTEIKQLIFDNFICPPTVIVRRQAWESVGFKYDENAPFDEDWWTWLRIALRYQFYYINDVVMYYRVHERSIRKILLKTYQTERSLEYILNHFFTIQEIPDSIIRLKRQVYSKHYRWLADAYFGSGMNSDCRRCLKICARWNHRYLLDLQSWRRYILPCLHPTIDKYVKRTYQQIFPKKRGYNIYQQNGRHK